MSGVAYQGLAGAFSEAAAAALFPDGRLEPRPTVADVFAALESSAVGAVVVPVENTHAGSVADVYDLLRQHQDARIVAEAVVRVRHCLLAVRGTRIGDVLPSPGAGTGRGVPAAFEHPARGRLRHRRRGRGGRGAEPDRILVRERRGAAVQQLVAGDGRHFESGRGRRIGRHGGLQELLHVEGSIRGVDAAGEPEDARPAPTRVLHGRTEGPSALGSASGSGGVGHLPDTLPRELTDPGLRAELTEMVIHVQVGPAKPGGVGHPAEERMDLPVEAGRPRRDHLEQRLDPRDVGRELDRPRAAALLRLKRLVSRVTGF